MSLRPVGITGIGAAVPERVLTNQELERMVETSDEWIRTRTGIRERRIAAPEEASSDYAIRAARKAMAQAGVTPDQVDLIICATVTPDMPFPATAVLVQDAIGAHGAAAFDLSAACPGWVYGVVMAQQSIATGLYNCALVIGVELLSKVVNWKDRSTCVLFGDAAGAAVLQPVSEGRGILASVLGSEGSGACHLNIPAGGSRMPTSPETVARGLHYVQMNGSEVFKFAVRVMNEATVQVVEKAGFGVSDIDLLVPHQANTRIIDSAVKRLGLDPERVVVNLDRYGNTSSASIPVALAEALEEGRLQDGDRVVCVSFGAGLVWGALALRWGR
ncbi:3-oxoacyl-[acyl-carrier-protein] synthase-3 [Symbiobacterium terraclitae]|uniref:Beta-ketoacyl-[acyl-carrier-protein] synthase III n=1 Tax=Symbiobacterium terraclitae TaxID=557451 RepID=A0ABS4JWB2_9FIRM|nr:beta-ketoacyl-ACP synthase III [Symbiobacterium terraclitae]MBP2019251.1 3-oxoacyl-[acyl-carrier-protein] synthase-3 [Symbiobacterium terraclitae]